MPITDSQIVEDRAQADGRRAVRERHEDHEGLLHFASYLAESGANVNTLMANRVALIEAGLKAREIAKNLARALEGFTGGFKFQWSTVNENLAALREFYKVARRFELLTIAHVLHHQSLSDAQIRGLFSVGVGQEQAVRDKLAAFDVKYHDILDDVGE